MALVRALAVAQFRAVCDWCKTTIPAGSEINIDRYEGTETEFAWEAFFCSNEHASMWVANPVEPIAQTSADSTWGDRAIGVFLLGVVLTFLALFVVGAVVSVRWLFGLIF